MSHPTMGAWIEIFMFTIWSTSAMVAPHDGCVDWNNIEFTWAFKALRRTPRWVRGLKFDMSYMVAYRILSHPTMGAWIEIFHLCILLTTTIVAPHDGCVDWNMDMKIFCTTCYMSHPTMGAWIEICISLFSLKSNAVAPHDGWVAWTTTI